MSLSDPRPPARPRPTPPAAPGLLRQLGAPLIVLAACIALGRAGGAYWSGVQAEVAQAGAMGAVLFVLAMALLGAACFPVAALAASAGALYGAWGGMALVLLAVLLAGMLIFRLGKGLLRARIQRLIEGRPRLAALDRLAAERALRLNLLARLSPLNFGLVSYALAVGRSGPGPYLLGLAGTLPSIVVWVLVGALAERAGASGRAGWGPGRAALLAAGVIVLILLSWQVSRQLRRALAEDERTAGGDPGDDGVDGGEQGGV